MYTRKHARAPARLTFFFFIYIFSHRSQKGNTQYELTLVRLCFVCLYAFLYVCGFLRLFSTFYCSVPSSSSSSSSSTTSSSSFVFLVLLSLFCSTITRSLAFINRSPPVLPSHENYPETRESKRDREVRRGGI